MQIVTSLLFIAVFLLGIFSLNKQIQNEVQASSFLPADTLVYLEQKDGAEAIRQFRNSQFGQVLESIDFIKVLQEADVEPAYLAIVDKTLASFKKLENDRLVYEILGERCAIAMFALRNWSDKAESLEGFVEDHLLLISKPRINAEALATLIAGYTGKIAVTVVPYGKYSIKRFEVDDEVVSVALTDGFILACLEERILREALDLHDKKVATLKTNLDFQRFRKDLDGAERMFYFSIDGLQALAEYGADHAATLKERAMLSELSSLKGIKNLAYGAWNNKHILKNRVVVRFKQDEMDSRVREMMATSPSINGTLPFVTRDVMLYYWSNTLNIRLLWDMYESEAGNMNQEVTDFRNGISDISGYELDDIMEMISGNVSIMVNENARDQFVPIPDIALLVKLKDAAHLGHVIQKSLKNLDIEIQSGNYKNIPYYYWGLYPQESLQPVYAIHRDYLIIANTLDILKTIIDTPINNSRLVAAEAFKELDPGFQTLNNSVFYIDQARLLMHMREFISWAGTMLAIQDRLAAEKSKILIDNLINPLFLGIAMYEKSATRTYMKNDRIIIESKTKISQ